MAFVLFFVKILNETDKPVPTISKPPQIELKSQRYPGGRHKYIQTHINPLYIYIAHSKMLEKDSQLSYDQLKMANVIVLTQIGFKSACFRLTLLWLLLGRLCYSLKSV